MSKKDLIKELISFNHKVTGLPIPKGAPSVQMVDQCSLINWIYEDYKTGCHELQDEDTTLEGGYYKNEIKLNSEIDLDTVWGQAVLAHELVHWMQDKSGHNVDNQAPCTLEPLAYKTQQEYLKAHGLKPAAFGITQKFINEMSRC